MTERIKLNKVFLREQKQKLTMYERFLPALEARKQQFLMQLGRIRKITGDRQTVLDGRLREVAVWSQLYWDIYKVLPFFVTVREVRVTVRNVAGLTVPEYQGTTFNEPAYSLFATPYSFDEVILRTREIIALREEIKILREQERILSEGFRKTSQRINLYEQKLIPGCREAIRRITVYLQDQQAAAVGVAKVAKRLSEEASTAGG